MAIAGHDDEWRFIEIMDQDTLCKIKANNKEIENLLKENENLLSEAGYRPPEMNFVLALQDRINIPSGYIRRSGDFWVKYQLDKIVLNRDVQNNVSYALQLSDFFNYLINRFAIWGSVETMLYKQDFVNLIAIMEAIVLACAANIRKNCEHCQKKRKCDNLISRRSADNLKNAISKLCSVGILDYTDSQKDRLIDLVNVRNRVHIRLAENNEFMDSKFNVKLHNETIGYLTGITNQIDEKAVFYYNNCIGYKEKTEY